MLELMLYCKEMLYMGTKDIREKIINYLKAQEWPSTTEDVAKGANISWNTAEVHLMKMQMEKKVMFRRVGRQNQWWLNDSYRRNMGK
jgi:predicted transcriptional regulator